MTEDDDRLRVFSCRTCGGPGPIVAGECERCNPVGFTAGRGWDQVFERYRRATGREALADWYRFEDWFEEQERRKRQDGKTQRTAAGGKPGDGSEGTAGARAG